ncbi:phosphate ABC transporter substrate-binding/OmpA family protein [Rheinheimera muenzenbergensis]|uniref:Phosphate ABC transporter substrate-binding/OmpA family protein n=1 Tax=Rheinheimera muenzenbergensis TaxID=1193628 RepID=A0ABU8CAJ4_9GAMM
MSSTSIHATKLASALTQLVQLCQSNFQIQLSVQQLQSDVPYRDTVLAELAQLDDASLQALITQIRQLAAEADTVSAAPAATPGSAAKPAAATVPVSMRWYGLAALLLLSTAAGAWYLAGSNTEPAAVQAAPLAAAAGVTASASAAMAAVPASAAPEVRLPLLRVHGSNTVGEKLAPALLEAFLASQGASQFSWHTQNSDVERLLDFSDNTGPNRVQLHAHGSGTAFKDLLSGKADVGMSSRRVTGDETDKARASLGDLSKIGNEHIIALDGLAVIVNQNNPLKAISTETLAKMFSGEISNWSQLGGADRPIVLLARDHNSGTYDTFNSLVLKKFAKKLSEKAQRFESSTELSVAVSQDEAAIGFIGLNYISYNKALAISEGADTTPIYPTRFTVSTEDYALSRRLYLYTPTSASQLAKDFAQFAISEPGQALVEQSGLISQNIRVEQVYPIEGAPATYNRYAGTGQRLSLNFRFNYGENDLDNKGKRDLQRLIRFMEQNSGRRLVLMGFSDSIGAVAKNTELALRRAKAVERELVSRGIAVMAVESYGELLPVANNDTDAGRERNRRVEVWVI